MMKNFLARIFAVWAVIIFVITMIPVVLIMWVIGIVNEPRRTSVFRSIANIWMRIFFFFTGCRLKIKGRSNFKPNEKYIVICNHNSFMDIPVTTPFIPGPNKTIAKDDMAKIPLFGLIYKRGSILVNRNDKNSRRTSFKKMKDVLGMKMHMCIYPEGTRNKTTTPIKEFHDGAFRLAVECETSIIPSLIFNTKKVLPPEKNFFFWPSKMELHFLSPIAVNKFDKFEEVKENLHNIMVDYYVAELAKSNKKS